MSAETKRQAIVKLKAIANKIGYPDHWRDYSSVVVKRDDALGNDDRADGLRVPPPLNKIGKPLDRNEWQMTPPTVNAYYDPQMNDINFPAGILQPPFFDNHMDDAVNFGGIGMVIGHELTHGFDDEGRQFDAQGNLHDWWTPRTPEDQRARGLRGGRIFQLQRGRDAHQRQAHAGRKYGRQWRRAGSADGAPQYRWEQHAEDRRLHARAAAVPGIRPGVVRERPRGSPAPAGADQPAPPGEFRVIGVVENMPEFDKAFACHAGQKMVVTNACRVW